MSDMQDPPLFAGRAIQIQQHPKRYYGDENKLEFLYKVNNKFFSVILSDRPSPGFDSPDCIGSRYLQQLEDCAWDGEVDDEPEDASDNYERLYNEIEDLLKPLFKPIFQELAPATGNQCQRQDLDAYMNPDTFNFRLESLKGEPKLVRRDDIAPPDFHPPMPDSTMISANIPSFSASAIKVLDTLAYSWVLKVLVNGEKMCCKLSNRSGHDSLPREYSSLQRIKDADDTSSIRVPSLRGVIRSRYGAVVGILLDYIQPTIPSLGIALSDGNAIAVSRKEKWAKQIEITLERLHSIGVVWGDAKTSNILIDENDDAWVIDFGGGQTIGWVETGLVGSKEGDLQALKKIIEALKT